MDSGLHDKFRELRGYDMTDYMPVITNRIVVNRDISNRSFMIPQDRKRLIADEFYRTFSEIALRTLFIHILNQETTFSTY
jgi:hypothetical protein